MLSSAVSFQLAFPIRRQLQVASSSASAVDPSSEAFQAQLRSAVAASLGGGVSDAHVLVAPTMILRTLEVTVVHFGSSTASALVATASSAAFLTDLGARVGTSISMPTAPSITMRTTDVPSPPPAPPSSPPSAPPPPPSVPPALPGPSMITGAASSSLSTATDAQTAGTGASTSTFSSSVVWVLIIIGVVAVGVVGCIVAYCVGCTAYRAGQRTGKSSFEVQVGRPALRRQITPEEASQGNRSSVSEADAAMDEASLTNVRMQDVRLIELGMAVERTMSVQRQLSGGAGPSTPSRSVTPADELANKLDDVQATIEGVRESLSPRSGSPRNLPPSAIPVDTRIRAATSLDFHEKI